MAAALAAARLGDPIEHSSALMGFLIGAAVGLAVGVAIVAATVATGGAALAVVAAVGAGMATTGGMALFGEALGHTFTSTTGNIVSVGSKNVHINSIPAARAITDVAACSKDGPAPIPIAQGSKIVRINSLPAARKGDQLVCGSKIAKGSPNVRIGREPGTFLAVHSEVPDWMNELAQGLVLVGTAVFIGFGAAAAFVGGGLCALIGFGGELLGGLVGGVVGGQVGGAIGKAVGGERGELIGEFVGSSVGGFFGAKAGGRLSAGHPVDVATGELFTEQADFRIHGPLPLVWSRLWISSSTIDGALGHGWHHTYDMALGRSLDTGYYVARLSDGRLALFTPPAPGDPALNTVERLMLHTDGERYWLADYEGTVYEFGSPAADGLRHLVRAADANENEIRLERNEAGHLFAMVDSAGRLFAVTHDEAGRILAIEGPHPEGANERLRLVTYRYDAAGDLIESRDARGGALQYAYSNHLMIEERRRGGLLFHFVWDDFELGRKARCLDTWGDDGNGGELFRATLAYDVDEQTTVVTTGRGAVSQYRWNAIGMVEEETDPLGAVTRRRYDGAGRLVEVTGPGGETAKNFYDALGRLLLRQNAAGETVSIGYGLQDLEGVGHANPSRITAPDGAMHTFAYDERGNLAMYTDPVGAERRFRRNRRGLPVEIGGGDGVWRRLEWSAAGELVGEGVERGARVRYGYDRLSRVVWLARGEDEAQKLVRDANGNVTAIHRADGGVVSLEYDAEDRVTRHRDALGRETGWRYDGLKFPRERIAADGSRFLYRYDSELNVVGLENAKGEQYVLDYDLAGRLVREAGFDGRKLDYRYDASGRLLEQLDAGRSTRFVRDALGRLLEKQFADGSGQKFGWDAAGRLVLAENAERKVEFGYDRAGRLATERQNNYAIQHGYDTRGRRVETVLPDGRRIGVRYGPDNLFSEVRLGKELVAEVYRDAAGREVQRTAGESRAVRQHQAYDPQGRLLAQQGYRGEGEVFLARRYQWDASDALSRIEDSRRGLKRYQYDPCEHLLAVDASWAPPEIFVVDPAGNILSSSGRTDGEAQGDRLLAHDDKEFQYDEHGNRVKERRTDQFIDIEYRYGPDNQLVEVLDRAGRVTRFGYDALGRRCWKATARLAEAQRSDRAWKRIEFLWNGDMLLAESGNRQDPLETVYLYEPGTFRPLAQAKRQATSPKAKVYHYHLDHLGTPQELTDGEGEVVWAADLKAWGQVRVKFVGKIANPLRFQGQYCDEETGLHYNRFRYYDPGTGSYVSPDPIGLDGGSRQYGYVHNPLSWVDPLGLADLQPIQFPPDVLHPGTVTPENPWGTYSYPATGSYAGDKQALYDAAGLQERPSADWIGHHVDYDPETNMMRGQVVDPDYHGGHQHIGGANDFEQATGYKYGTDEAVAEANRRNNARGATCG